MDYMTPNISEELFVDTSRSPKIQINLDVVVPQVSCDCMYKIRMFLIIISINV